LEKIVLDTTNILIEILKSNDEIAAKLKKFVKSFEVLHIDEGISAAALKLVAKYAKNHNIKLYTLNTKDFRFIDGLILL